MNRLLHTMYRLYFYHRAVYWSLGLAALLSLLRELIAPGFSVWGTHFFVLMLLTGVPTITVITQYGISRSNRHLAMVPYGRLFSLGATFCLLAIMDALVSQHITAPYLPNAGKFAQAFLVIFCLCTIGLVLDGIRSHWRITFPLLLAILIFPAPVKLIWDLIAGLDPEKSYSVLLLLILAGWTWLVLDLRRPPGKVDHDSRSEFFARLAESLSRLSLLQRLNVDAQLRFDAPKSLFFGAATVLRNGRLLFAVLRYVLVPIVALVYFWIVVDPAFWGEALLLIQFFVNISLPISAANWVANLRTLWLRVSGDRNQFWRIWSKSLHAELGLAIIMLLLYGAVVLLIFDVPNTLVALYLVSMFVVLPSFCYAAAWFQLSGAFGSVLAVSFSIIYFCIVFLLAVVAYALGDYGPLWVLAAITASVGTLAYFRVKKGFASLDWLQVRTITPVQF